MAGQADWTPMQVLEHTLQVSGDALMTGDFRAFASIFDLPHEISTFEGKKILRSEDDIRDVFDSVRRQFELNQVDSLVRQCISAEFDEKGRIKATHTTRILSDDRQIGQTSMGYSILHLKTGRWLGLSSQYAVAEKSMSEAIIVTSNASPPDTELADATDNVASLDHERRKRSL